MTTWEEPSAEEASLLVDQARWLAERWEFIAEGFLTRAGIFLGMLGVEAAVIASSASALWARALSLTVLVAPGLFFLAVFRRTVTQFPPHVDLVDAALGGRSATWLVIEQNLKVVDPGSSLTEQFKSEARRRGRWCSRGLYALIGVQPLIAAMIVRGSST